MKPAHLTPGTKSYDALSASPALHVADGKTSGYRIVKPAGNRIPVVLTRLSAEQQLREKNPAYRFFTLR